jgi:hypothetical protein
VAKRNTAAEGADLGDLVRGIVEDFGRLLGQQVDLLRGEVRREVHRAAGAALSVAVGGGLVAAGGLLSGLALAHLAHRATGLPLWCCYGAAAGACGAAGAALVYRGGERLTGVTLLPPPQTTAALEENLTWLKEQVTPAAP